LNLFQKGTRPIFYVRCCQAASLPVQKFIDRFEKQKKN
jgi:hypothetical protein